MTKKILYLMHVDWEWTKQRPQFIAEGLSKFYELYVFFPTSYVKKLQSIFKKKEFNSSIFLSQIPHLPLYTRIRFIYNLNKFIWKLYIKFMIKKYNPNYIWITFPALYDYIPSDTKSKVIYDCMDDAIAFDPRFYFRDKLLKSEKELIKRSSVIFVSSTSLANKLNQREKCIDKVVLNRNAFDGIIFDTEENSAKPKKIYKIGYVGSISSWFDFESLYYTLKTHENIEYHLIGPIDNIPRSHKRIKIHGLVDHADLWSYVKDFDCFIMPFKLNELIISVDPVKLNEYINYNKPIISVYYDEIKRFSPFVSFYRDKQELSDILGSMIKQNFPKTYSDEERINFLKSNTWDERIKTILKNLD